MPSAMSTATVNQAFMEETFATSTVDAVFFDTAILLDEVGGVRFAVHKGEPLEAPPSEIFGSSLPALTRELVRDGITYDVRTGVLATKWGLAIVAVGTVVPFTKDFEPRPERSRILILGKVFDDGVVSRLSEDFLIPNFHLIDVASRGEHTLDIVDPAGKVVGALAWSPPSLGNEAHAQVSPTVFMMLALVGLTMAFLIAIALRGVREVERREAAARHAATNDELSGLPNRAALVAALDRGDRSAPRRPHSGGRGLSRSRRFQGGQRRLRPSRRRPAAPGGGAGLPRAIEWPPPGACRRRRVRRGGDRPRRREGRLRPRLAVDQLRQRPLRDRRPDDHGRDQRRRRGRGNGRSVGGGTAAARRRGHVPGEAAGPQPPVRLRCRHRHDPPRTARDRR